MDPETNTVYRKQVEQGFTEALARSAQQSAVATESAVTAVEQARVAQETGAREQGAMAQTGFTEALARSAQYQPEMPAPKREIPPMGADSAMEEALAPAAEPETAAITPTTSPAEDDFMGPNPVDVEPPPAEEDIIPEPVESVGESPEMNPNPIEERPTEDIEAEAAEEAALTAEAETPPGPAAGQTAEVLGVTTSTSELTPVAPQRLEAARGWARNLRDRLVNNFERYKEHPGDLLRDGKKLLEDGAKAWWNGIMPVDFYRDDVDKSWSARWQKLNMIFYTGGVAAGAVVDIIAVLPGLGGLRPASRLALASGMAIAIGWSETREKRKIEENNPDVEEKRAKLEELQNKYRNTHTWAKNIAHGMAAGMIMGGIVQAFGVDKAVADLFKPTPEEVPSPAGVVEGASETVTPPTPPTEVGSIPKADQSIAPPAPEPPVVHEVSVPDAGVIETAAPQDIVFKVPEGSNLGFWKVDFSPLGEAAHNWGISATQGSDKTAILGMILRQNAGEFGSPGDTLSYSKLGENSLKLIKLLGESKSQTDFLANGGQNLINLVNAGQT